MNACGSWSRRDFTLIAQRFSAGGQPATSVPLGTAEGFPNTPNGGSTGDGPANISRPYGTETKPGFPAINRRAIFECPFGTKTEVRVKSVPSRYTAYFSEVNTKKSLPSCHRAIARTRWPANFTIAENGSVKRLNPNVIAQRFFAPNRLTKTNARKKDPSVVTNIQLTEVSRWVRQSNNKPAAAR